MSFGSRESTGTMGNFQAELTVWARARERDEPRPFELETEALARD
jgi:hypothetical protein